MLTDGIEQILFCMPCSARSLSRDVLALAFALCPGPPVPRPPHTLASAAHQPVSNLLCTKVATGFRVLGTVFSSWQHYRGCLVLPLQLLHEGKYPQTINYRAAPFAHKHWCHGNLVHIQRQACVCDSWEHGDMDCPTVLPLLVSNTSICQRWALSFCVMLLSVSSEEAQGDIMLGEICLR